MTRVPLLIVLALVPVAAQTGPVLSDAPGAQRLAFDAVSIKTNRTNAGVPGMTAPPGRFTATNMWVRFVIQNAWGVRDDEIYAQRGPVEVLVVERIERPTEN